MRKAAQKIHALKTLWQHQIKLNTGRDYEQEFKRIYIVYYGPEIARNDTIVFVYPPLA